MATSIPLPLNALRALEIVARTGALAPAAAELGVTPGAVSQHIRRAEDRLGLVLFERTSKGLVPSPALSAVQPALHKGFQTLFDACAELAPVDNNVLTITVGNVFASRWLVWRLNRFAERAPQIELRTVTTGTLIDLSRPDIDCGVRFGFGNWAGLTAERIGGYHCVPICTPEVAARLKSPQDLANVPVITDEGGSLLSWEDWFAGAGISNPPPLKDPAYSDPATAFDAAIAGQGVLLTMDMMAADALALGRLVRPFSYQLPTSYGYWFVMDADAGLSPKIRLFRDWLRAESKMCTI
jgi:DNA-binding transcriptional LysR family regulator